MSLCRNVCVINFYVEIYLWPGHTALLDSLERLLKVLLRTKASFLIGSGSHLYAAGISVRPFLPPLSYFS